MGKKKSASKSEWIDPDDAPELTEEWFESADYYEGGKLIRPGRPRAAAPKEAISLRLDPDIVAHFRATGPGWQSRINEALRKAVKL
ncbi:MAG: BrnA antitoxin family protein [Alphaproteobacteria bacterium]